jgi:hypothetical protein
VRPTPPRRSPGSALLIYLPGTALIPRLRSGFRQRAQTPAKRLNFGWTRIPSRGPDRHSIGAGCQRDSERIVADAETIRWRRVFL